MNYLQFALRLASFVTAKPDLVDYSVVLPAVIDSAEQRCYRELDLLSSTVRDGTSQFRAGYRDFALPTGLGTFIVVQSVNVITPANVIPNNGARSPLTPVSRDFLDSVWGSSAAAQRGVPAYFAMIDNANIIVGPWPDSTYYVEVIGTMRPRALSSSNPTTFLTTTLPDLFFAAAMAFFSRALVEYGAKTEQGPEFWENQFQLLKQSAIGEEYRKRFAAGDWTPTSTPNP